MDSQSQEAVRWPFTRLFTFRVAFVYLVPCNLPFPLGSLPYTNSLSEKYQMVWHKVVLWVAKQLFRHDCNGFNFKQPLFADQAAHLHRGAAMDPSGKFLGPGDSRAQAQKFAGAICWA